MSTNPTILHGVTVTPEIAKLVGDANSPDAIRGALMEAAQKQTAEAIERETAQALAEATAKKDADAVVAAQRVSRTEVIGNREFTFEAATEAELNARVLEAYRVAYALQPESRSSEPVPVEDPEVTAAAQRQADEAKVARLAELDLQFKRGDITTKQYLEQSGAMDQYLAEKGISIPTLQATVQQSQANNEQQAWADAVGSFLQDSDWPGGDRNLALMQTIIQGRGLLEADDKVQVLLDVYAEMREKNMIFEETPAPTTTTSAVTVTQTHITPAVPAPKQAPAAASGLFGVSAGTSAAVLTATPSSTQKFDVPTDASPAVILDFWKKQQIAEGKNPDDVFMSSFTRR